MLTVEYTAPCPCGRAATWVAEYTPTNPPHPPRTDYTIGCDCA